MIQVCAIWDGAWRREGRGDLKAEVGPARGRMARRWRGHSAELIGTLQTVDGYGACRPTGARGGVAGGAALAGEGGADGGFGQQI
jgi:hypothetical protein